MRYACIDIGSNTTRLLVAEPRGPGLHDVHHEKAFTRIGRDRARTEPIAPEKIAEVAGVVAAQAARAGALGCTRLRVVATAAIREAPNAGELVAAIGGACGEEVVILGAEDEARLAFAGATAGWGDAATGEVAVVDVGGGSSEIAVGTLADGVSWWASFPVGSGLLADAHLHTDPPTAHELAAVRHHVATVFADLDITRPQTAVAVGGSATSLRRLCGGTLDADTMRRGVSEIAGAPSREVAARRGLEPERVRLLPAGMLLLGGIAERIGRPLEIATGGLREGIVLELVAGAERFGR
jgi:exopolyphosphatase/guanosine-5'-triphosphate,3'-diphosphate pyrophosphatase